MIVASFNINGVKARLPALLQWLEEAKPDVVEIGRASCRERV